ncbi:hypothetical protein PanWU01x14_148770 [Parasponia andersonii]|uniref:Uncharacterized protein n=1 Tax=Parasponia andersonii TaxID=3476 RepID=A0A2P5CJ63_PARAD|nr:hypothetical protein PanWU01x14_148770 [Parasponia andersonii]
MKILGTTLPITAFEIFPGETFAVLHHHEYS